MASDDSIISVDHEGRTYRGIYTIDRGLITVHALGTQKTTLRGGSTAQSEGLARIMLRDIVRER